jgi:hypothetical protein
VHDQKASRSPESPTSDGWADRSDPRDLKAFRDSDLTNSINGCLAIHERQAACIVASGTAVSILPSNRGRFHSPATHR